ncbi:MAG: aspartate aminotransferase family protein [Aestuariivirga sp.]
MNISNSRISERTIKYKWSPFSRSQILERDGVVPIVRGAGARVFDIEGKSYLDCHAGLWLVNAGYGRSEIAEAISRQAHELAWFSSFEGFTNLPSTDLAERLVALLKPEGMAKVFFSSGGSDAAETALKIARMYWKLQGQGQRYKIISRERAYHGVSFGAMSATGMPANRNAFEPLVPGFRHAIAPDRYRHAALSESEAAKYFADDVERLIVSEGPASVAALIAEPIQGAGGVIIPPQGYLQRVQEICRKHGVLLILDEVITGFGRTGEWFGARNWGLQPDMITMAKGLTSGYLPLGATAVTEKLFEVFRNHEAKGGAFRHGNTYSGHPIACAAALANIDIIDSEGLVANAKRVGAHLLSALKPLEDHAMVGEVSGLGLIGRVQLTANRTARTPLPPALAAGDRIAAEMRRRGVIMRQLPHDVLSYSPPLCLTIEEANELAGVFHEAIEVVYSQIRKDL